MKFALVFALFASASAFATSPQQTYTSQKLTYWFAGAEDVVIGGGIKESCSPQDQAYVTQGAQQDALAKCNADPAGYRCFVSSATITFDGNLDDSMLQKYGLQNSQFSLNTLHGCEATATVFGF